MEGLHTLPDSIQSQDWMVKLDLKDIYLQALIHQDHQPFLQFQWEQERYQFVCLSLGLTSAPQVFHKNNETSGAATGHLSDGRTSARKGEFDGRQGVRNDERSLRLDVESDHLQPDLASNGPMWVRSVCLLPNTATNKVLQLETRPRSRENRCIQSELVHHRGVCQPPVVPDSQISEPDKTTTGQINNDRTSLGSPNHGTQPIWECWRIIHVHFQWDKI